LPLRNRGKTKKSKLENLKLLFEGLALLGAGVSAWLTFSTLREVKRQTIEITRSAKAAEDSIKLMRQQLIGTQAAVLDSGVALNDPGELTFYANNIGHVVAKNVHIVISASQGKLPMRESTVQLNHV
jgi:hypothetical protein